MTWGALVLAELPYHPAFALTALYFTALTYVLLHWQEQAMVEDPKGFVRRFMLGLMLKMMVSLILVVCIMLLGPKQVLLPLVLSFALLYLAFLGFSTFRLVTRSRH